MCLQLEPYSVHVTSCAVPESRKNMYTHSKIAETYIPLHINNNRILNTNVSIARIFIEMKNRNVNTHVNGLLACEYTCKYQYSYTCENMGNYDDIYSYIYITQTNKQVYCIHSYINAYTHILYTYMYIHMYAYVHATCTSSLTKSHEAFWVVKLRRRYPKALRRAQDLHRSSQVD